MKFEDLGRERIQEKFLLQLNLKNAGSFVTMTSPIHKFEGKELHAKNRVFRIESLDPASESNMIEELITLAAKEINDSVLNVPLKIFGFLEAALLKSVEPSDDINYPHKTTFGIIVRYAVQK